jgi:hypothetical protein
MPDPTLTITASFYDPAGRHVETVDGPPADVAEQARKFIAAMAGDRLAGSIEFEPEIDNPKGEPDRGSPVR